MGPRGKHKAAGNCEGAPRGSRPGTETYQPEPARAAASAQLTIQSYIVSYVILFVDLTIFVLVS